jgi:hypothetical protein
MAELVTLAADGPLGKAGTQVWVDDPSQAVTPDGWVDPNPAPKLAKGKQAAATSEEPPADASPDEPPAS